MPQDNGAVAVVDDKSSSALTEQLTNVRHDLRNVEVMVSQKEAELRRVKEENALMKELRSIDEVMAKKTEKRQGKKPEDVETLKVSTEMVEELVALNNAVKFENARTAKLEEEAAFTQQKLRHATQMTDDANARIERIKNDTGYNENSLVVKDSLSLPNEHAERKRALALLKEQHDAGVEASARLTREIESLTTQMDQYAHVDEEIAKARESLMQQNNEYDNITEEIKSYKRLRKKKELLVNRKEGDKYAAVRALDSDKRVLHNQITTYRSTLVKNEASIDSIGGQMQKMDARLRSIETFLKKVFAEAEDEEPLEGIADEAGTVPLARFEELNRELELTRQTIECRDDQLNAHDATVEQLEQKICILQNAISSRAVSSQLHVREKEKEFEILMSHVDQIKNEFECEQKRLSHENARLREALNEA